MAVITGGNRGGRLRHGPAASRRRRAAEPLGAGPRDRGALEAAAAELSPLAEMHVAAVDVGDEAAVRAAATATMARLGQVDILVSNAGVFGRRAAVADFPAAEFEQVLRINLVGTFLCCAALAPHMTAAGYGRIVNVASVAGKDGNPFVSAYVASKASQIGFTKSLAKELAETGVLVNAVTPYASRTEIFGEVDEARARRLLAYVAMGRFVEPDEVARLIAWLASEACSFSTGAAFDVSGGRATY